MKRSIWISMIMAVLWSSGVSHAGDRSIDSRSPGSGGSREVVSGNYYCSGSIYTDEQPAEISVGFYLGATSNLTTGYFAPSRRSRNVAADLGTMSETCRSHIDAARSEMPSICVLGDNEEEGGEFGNGESISVAFQFTCQGNRDRVVGVIGYLAELAVRSIPSGGR